MTILFGLLTALANAIAVALQHIASTSQREATSRWRFVLYLIRHPLWLLGWVALAGSLLFQALALHFGPLSVVQPLLVSELVLALVLRRFWIHQSIRSVTWVAAVITTAGLVLFLATTTPTGGAHVPANTAWAGPILACAITAGLLTLLARDGSPSRRAGLLASATAVLWALEATFIKATTDALTSFGVGGTLTRWPLYAFAIGGVAGLLCEQAALHVGPLSVSQLFIVIVDPIVAIVLGIWIYGERFHAGVPHLAVGGLAFLAMCVGVVLLTRTAPATMTADVHRV